MILHQNSFVSSEFRICGPVIFLSAIRFRVVSVFRLRNRHQLRHHPLKRLTSFFLDVPKCRDETVLGHGKSPKKLFIYFFVGGSRFCFFGMPRPFPSTSHQTTSFDELSDQLARQASRPFHEQSPDNFHRRASRPLPLTSLPGHFPRPASRPHALTSLQTASPELS